MKALKPYLKTIAAGMILGAAAFGLSVRISDHPQTGALNVAIPSIVPVLDALRTKWDGGVVTVVSPEKKQFVVAGVEKAHASESMWLGVRQSATWANNNSSMADGIITALKNAGLLANSGTTQTTTTIGGVSYKVQLKTGAPACSSLCSGKSSSAYTGTKNFTNRFKMWRASDGKDVLELLFDNVTSSANGVLLTYRLAILAPTTSDNEGLIVESYIQGSSPSRRQTYSWGGQFWINPPNSANTPDRGRVVLEEMTVGLKGGGTGTGLCVRVATRSVSMTTACGTGPHYYTVAYGQKTVGNFETTAVSGLAVSAMPGTVPATSFCGGPGPAHGEFNGGGFVTDGLGPSQIANGYPDASINGSYNGVDGLFSKLGTGGTGGPGGYDDTQKATIDAFNTTVVFPNTDSTPPF